MEQNTETLSEKLARAYPNATIRRPGPDDPIFREPVTITSGRFMKPEDGSQKKADSRQETTTTKLQR